MQTVFSRQLPRWRMCRSSARFVPHPNAALSKNCFIFLDKHLKNTLFYQQSLFLVKVPSAPLFYNWQLLTIPDLMLMKSVHLVQICLKVLDIICEYLSIPLLQNKTGSESWSSSVLNFLRSVFFIEYREVILWNAKCSLTGFPCVDLCCPNPPIWNKSDASRDWCWHVQND